MRGYPRDISVIVGERVALTAEENDWFEHALFLFCRHIPYDRDFFYVVYSNDALKFAPLKRLALCADGLENRVFAQSLLVATLDIYHETHEWLGLFYITALKSDEGFEVIANALLNGPVEHRVFLNKVVCELEAEICDHIASDYRHIPYDLVHKDSTYLFFDQVYREALIRVIALRHAVIWRRPLFR